jgi:hypothetical protein
LPVANKYSTKERRGGRCQVTSRYLIPALIATTLAGCDPHTIGGRRFIPVRRNLRRKYTAHRKYQQSILPYCPSAQIVIADGNLEYRHLHRVIIIIVVHTRVHDDGSFSGRGFRARLPEDGAENAHVPDIEGLEGKVSGNSIEATTEDHECTNHLSLKKVSAGSNE